MPDRDCHCAVLVHGAGGGGWEWVVWQRVFCARGWSVLAPDLLPARAGLAATRLADYEAQVRAWCAGADARFVLIGASLGGLLAALAAADGGSEVAGGTRSCVGLVLINPLLPEGMDPHPRRVTLDGVVPWGRERSIAGTRRSLPDADDAARLFAFRRWRDESAAVLRDAANATVAAPRCPTLVIASARDEDCAPAASRALAERLAADFRLLAGASHVGPLLGRDAPIVAEETLRWLEPRVRVR